MTFNKFTDEQIKELKSEFDSLNTLPDKFQFWINKLKHSYMWVGVEMPTNEVNDFLIIPKSAEEKKEFNYLLIDEIETFFSIVNHNPFIYAEQLQNQLVDRLEELTNPLPVLKDSLKWIELQEENYSKKPSHSDSDNYFKKLSLHSSWIESYNNLYLKGFEVDYSIMAYNMASIVGVHNGCEVAKFRIYVEKKIWEVENKQISPYQYETPLKKQLLLMEYTGILKVLNSIKKSKDRERLLSVLLNKSQNSIKTELANLAKSSYTFKVRTEENYTFLLNLFMEIGLNDKAEEVKNELDKLRQVKK